MKRVFILLLCMIFSVVTIGCATEKVNDKLDTMENTTEEIIEEKQEMEDILIFQPDMEKVIKICIPEIDIPKYSNTGEAPDKLVFQIDSDTKNTFELIGQDERGNYIYEKVKE